MTDPEASRRWLLSRVDERCLDAAERLLHEITEHLATATGDAVSVRVLSPDRHQLTPVYAFHPDPLCSQAMAAVMSRTQSPHEGLWRTVFEERRVCRWTIPPGHVPSEASPEQAAFVEQFNIRAVVAAPLEVEDLVVGGVALVRFTIDREFADDVQALLTACAQRLAPALYLRQSLARLNGG